MDKGTESVAVLNKALEVPGIDKDKIYSLFGKLYERQAKWEDAIEYYTKAILYSLSDLTLVEYRKDVERVKFKMGM
jgi:tetratricopeptide (TPR) repeat protein